MKKYSRICARIDLDAIEYNIEMMRKNIRDDAKMLVVIKTDGYGHGALPIARLLSGKEYIWGYATATLEEAVSLRRHEVTEPILVLGCVFPEQWEEAIRHDVRMTVYTADMARGISSAATRLGRPAYIHIKIDTGMARLGFAVKEKSVEEIAEISRLPGLILEGMYTHFAKADETDKEFTRKQIGDYCYMKQALEERGVRFAYYHCSNSAGIIDVPEANMDLVRAGISTYGLYPSEEVEKCHVPLKPAMELVSHVTHVKTVGPGTPVSYGSTYITDRDTTIATIPAGYGDGYPRSLSNKGYVLIHGKRAPILGRVCMDQFMVDVSEIAGVQFGDEVVLAGVSGSEHLPVEVLSDLSGRFNYEFVCDLGKRIPREYRYGGEVVWQKDYFD